MVDKSQGISEINVCKIYVLVRESCVFESGYDHLYLSRGVALWPKALMT